MVCFMGLVAPSDHGSAVDRARQAAEEPVAVCKVPGQDLRVQ